METESFFCQLFKLLPQTLFELIGQPPERAKAYHFESIEIKKSFRIDGLLLPNEPVKPVYFVEVQFHRSPTFYANLFAKVFLFLEANPLFKDWAAVAIFESRSTEPKDLGAYEDLLRSKRVTRIYLNEYEMDWDSCNSCRLRKMKSRTWRTNWFTKLSKRLPITSWAER